MHADIQQLQVKLKEILYDCVAGVKATKAALYLLDKPASRFELVTEYGFKSDARQSAADDDPIVDRCERGRGPFFVNGLMAEPRLSEILFEAQTDRLLVAPIHVRGQLVGFVDMRDKAGKQPFDASDLPKAQQVADKVAELFATRNAFGQRFVTMSGNEPMSSVLTGVHSPTAQLQPAPPPFPRAMATPQPFAPLPAATPPPRPAVAPGQAMSFVPRVSSLVLEARTAAERIRVPAATETLSDAEMAPVREILRSVLLLPGAIVAVFSAFGHLGGVQEIAARALLTDDALGLLQSKLNSWLANRGENGGALRNRVQMPFGATGPAITAGNIKKVFTAPIAAGPISSLYLSAGFSNVPERGVHELLAVFPQQLQMAIEQSMSRRLAAASRLRIAEKVVEPDFCRFPELRRHSDAVVACAETFARFLGLPAPDSEAASVVALVHDAGMRLLDYDRLYRKRDVPSDELNLLRRHSIVGAAIADPLLGAEIARAVLCHHERFDGQGYPNRISGQEIPLLSRIVQICDAYETMTSADSYQPRQTSDAAVAAIVHGSGTQFDPDLARRFDEMMRAAPRG